MHLPATALAILASLLITPFVAASPTPVAASADTNTDFLIVLTYTPRSCDNKIDTASTLASTFKKQAVNGCINVDGGFRAIKSDKVDSDCEIIVFPNRGCYPTISYPVAFGVCALTNPPNIPIFNSFTVTCK